MIRACDDLMIEIGTEDELAILTVSLRIHPDRDERRVFNKDATALCRRHQPKIPGFVAPEGRRQKLDKGDPADRRTFMEPSSILSDMDIVSFVLPV